VRGAALEVSSGPSSTACTRGVRYGRGGGTFTRSPKAADGRFWHADGHATPALARLEEARERRALASAERTGRHARSWALRLNVQFARSRWRPLFLICLVSLLTLPIVI